MDKKTVGIGIFDDIEVLDFCGPFEVFSVARLDEAKRREEPSPFDVKLISQNGGQVRTSGGMLVCADYGFDTSPRLDILCVPGGWGTRRELDNPVMLSWLRERAEEVELVTSVCTGSMLLGFAGLLEGRCATTHWRSLEWMAQSFPKTKVIYDQHVVDDGSLISSAGISAGIDMALTVVKRYCGEAVARATARHMEYPFPETNDRRITDVS